MPRSPRLNAPSLVALFFCFDFNVFWLCWLCSILPPLGSRPVKFTPCLPWLFCCAKLVYPIFFLFVAISIGDGLFIRQAIFEYYPIELSASEDFNEIIAFSQVRNYISGVIFEDTEEWVKTQHPPGSSGIIKFAIFHLLLFSVSHL